MSSARWQCVDRLALGLWLALLGVDALEVIRGRDQRSADHRCRAETSARALLLLAVDALRVLAECRLHPRRLPQRHFVDGPAPAFQRYRLAADRVAGAGVYVDCQHSAADSVAKPHVRGVDRVDGTHMRGDWLGHLVGVLAGPALGFLAHADVPVRLDEAGQDPRSGGVDNLSAVGNGHRVGCADGDDPAVLDQDRPAGDIGSHDRGDPAANNCHRTVSHLTSLPPW